MIRSFYGIELDRLSLRSYYQPTLLEQLKYLLRKTLGLTGFIKTKPVQVLYDEYGVALVRDQLKSYKLGRKAALDCPRRKVEKLIAVRKSALNQGIFVGRISDFDLQTD